MNTDKLRDKLTADNNRHRAAQAHRARLEIAQIVAIMAIIAIAFGIAALTALAWVLP